ncbi:MAG: hypothetical protein AB7J28_13260 [Hyphomonadaceae bacterium]
MNLPLSLSAETLAMLMIGDGVLMAAQPRRHMSVWRIGPEPLREAVDALRERPYLTTALGIAQVGIGLYLASRIRPTLEHRAE